MLSKNDWKKKGTKSGSQDTRYLDKLIEQNSNQAERCVQHSETGNGGHELSTVL